MAHFHLDARVLIGAKVWLTADVPTTSLLRVPLKLSLVGSVTLVQSVRPGPKRQAVSLRLDKHFRLSP